MAQVLRVRFGGSREAGSNARARHGMRGRKRHVHRQQAGWSERSRGWGRHDERVGKAEGCCI